MEKTSGQEHANRDAVVTTPRLPLSLPRMAEQSLQSSTGGEIRSTTVLASNIHCASCVTHIQDVLGRLGSEILDVNVSVVSGEVNILHSVRISTDTLCRVLADEAFELFSASTVGQDDRVVSESSFAPNAEGWLDSPRNALWRSKLQSPEASQSCFQAPPRNKRKRHLENCAICQAKEQGDIIQPKPSFNKKDLSKTGEHLHGDNRDLLDEKTIEDVRQQAYGSKSDTEVATYKDHNVECNLSSQSNQFLDEDEEKVPDVQRWKLLLSVGGMTCASCTSAITRALQELDQVRNVSVDLMGNSTSIDFEGSKTFSGTIVETIEDIGYEATVAQITLQPDFENKPEPQPVSKVSYLARLSIGGMTCVSCSNAITQGLRELSFVQEVSVAALTHSGTVQFKDCSNLDTIVERVEDLGYECSVESCEVQSPIRNSTMDSKFAKSRTIQVEIHGMFCEHCPPRVMDALRSKFASSVLVDKAPTVKDPVMTITYQPAVPYFTIRAILSAIDSISKEFTASIFHPPSIEERSKAMQAHEKNRLLQRLALCTVVVIPTFLIGVVWMDLVSETNPQRIFFASAAWSGSVTRGEWALFILATPIFFLAADVFHLRAMKEIRALWRPGSKVPILRRFYRFGSMNLLISAGTSIAYISSLAMLIINATSANRDSNSTTYFDSVVFLTFFILIGRYLEAVSKTKTGNAVSMLGKLRPHEATLVVSEISPAAEGGDTHVPSKMQIVAADLLEVGDRVIVACGSSPPADGVISTGQGKFDESSLTGESRSVGKGIGEKVFVGTINNGNPVTIEVTEIGGTSMLDQIVAVVREGLSKRAPVERVADVITGYFVPVISGLAIITFVVWVTLGYSGALDPVYLGNSAGGWAFWSLEFAIAVFVVACPCGIGLAAPTALFVGIGLAAKHGILVRGGGEAFQEAPHVDAIVFDKTGTLTEGGELKVTDCEIFTDEEQETPWAIIASLEEQSTHPIAKAILEHSHSQQTTGVDAETISEVPGLGMQGIFLKRDVKDNPISRYEAAIGSQALIESLEPDLISRNTYASQLLSTWQTQCKSTAILALRKLPAVDESHSIVSSDTETTDPAPWTIRALFSTSDPLRPSALPTIRALQARNIPVYILSGDNPTTASAVGASLGIPRSNIFAGVLPTEKAAKIKHLQQALPSSKTGSRHQRQKQRQEPARIAFVGDGINDAPALQTAHPLSISLASGSPIALTASSFVLLGDSLDAIPRLLDLSARVFRRVKFNYAWALVYNVVLVPVAAGVLFEVGSGKGGGGGGWRLGPVWAAAAMAGSSVSVVLSSLALRVEWRGNGKGKGDVGMSV